MLTVYVSESPVVLKTQPTVASTSESQTILCGILTESIKVNQQQQKK